MNREVCKHYNDPDTCEECDREAIKNFRNHLKQQLQQAHRAGFEEGKKQTAREILDALTQEEIRRITSVGDPRVTTISSKLLAMMTELRQRYGLEG